MDQVAQVFVLLEKRNRADSLSGWWGLPGKTEGWGSPGTRRPGARLPAHLALQVEARVAVGEVRPEQQRVLILFPRQAVTVIVEVKGLPPAGGTGRHE